MIVLCQGGPLDNQMFTVPLELVHYFDVPGEEARAMYVLASDPADYFHVKVGLVEFSGWEYRDNERGSSEQQTTQATHEE
jgi:hypothetical protein